MELRCHKPRNAWDRPMLERGQEGFLPYRFQRGHDRADTLIWTFSLQNCKTIHFRCFKAPLLWYFVMAALRISPEGCLREELRTTKRNERLEDLKQYLESNRSGQAGDYTTITDSFMICPQICSHKNKIY